MVKSSIYITATVYTIALCGIAKASEDRIEYYMFRVFEPPTRVDNSGCCHPKIKNALDCKIATCCSLAAASLAEYCAISSTGEICESINPDVVAINAISRIGHDNAKTYIDENISSLKELGLLPPNCDFRLLDAKHECNIDGFAQLAKCLIARCGFIVLCVQPTLEWMSLNHNINKNGYEICGKDRRLELGPLVIDATHCVIACGYDERGVKFLNCYGEEWGRDGYGFITWDELKYELRWFGFLEYDRGFF